MKNLFRNRTYFYCVLILFVIIVGCKSTKESSELFSDFIKSPETSLLADFSYAGYQFGEKPIPKKQISIDVTKHGVTVNSKLDQTKQIQKLIDSIGAIGGGVLFFPSGKYLLNNIKNERNFLTIDYSNIVLKGEKNTVFMDCQTLIQTEKSPWLSPAIIRVGNRLQGTEKFWGIPSLFDNSDILKETSQIGVSGDIYPAKILSKITQNSKKGSKLIQVESTTGIHSGDFILIAMYNTTDNGNLIHKIMRPWETFEPYMKTTIDAGPTRAASYQWMVEVDSISSKIIYLKQPCRTDILTEFKPILASATMLKNIGIEDITFKSKWHGEYCHHGCKSSTELEGRIMDYGWNAIQFVRVAHGWIENVKIENFTSGISLLDSKNITVQDVTISGHNGHYGIKMYSHANDNLIQYINFKANFTHMLSVEGNSYGNVFREVNYDLNNNPLKADFDFHGFGDKTFAPPSDNLFELITGFNNITGGGSTFNLPHTATGNTFWNVRFDGLEKDEDLFRYWVYEFEKFGARAKTDDYIYFPGTIVTGATSKNGKIVIDNTSEDRNTDWLYFKDINERVLPLSLYEAQLINRVSKKHNKD